MNFATFGELTNGVLTLHPVFTVTHFDGKTFDQAKFPTTKLTIDGAKVEQCDSVGIAALIWLVKKAQEADVPLTWENIPPTITHLLDLYELDLSGLTEYARTTD